MQPPVILRVAMLLTAVAVGVWLVAGLVASDGLKGAGEAVAQAQGRAVTPAEFEDARGGLERARRFGDDSAPLYAEIGLLIVAGRGEEALAVAEEIVRQEPENFEGWRAVYGLSLETDPERAAFARRRALELNPLAERRLPRSAGGS